MREVATIVIIFGCFALIHSICVRERTKRMVSAVLGETFVKVFYRFFYTLFSIITASAAFYLINSLPDQVLFQGPQWFRWLMHAIQAGGLVFGLLTFRELDAREFMGIRQIQRFISNREVTGDTEGMTINRLVTGGTYGIVRHPLYLAGIIIFTFEPNITRNWLTVSILADLYFIYGALAEEKRLKERFGSEYEEYMKRVPRFIPCSK